MFVSACSDSSNSQPSLGAAVATELPTSTADTLEISGKMSFWMYEGDAGCYGALNIDNSEIQLWSSADKCIDTDYSENQSASIKITYNPGNQYGPGKTYTVVGF